MATKCFKSLQGIALRVTRLDSCCNPPATGTVCSFVTSESFIQVDLTAELEEPDEFITKLANGKICLNEIGCATLKRYLAKIEVCNADPDLFQIISGVNLVTDPNGDKVGYQVDYSLGDCNTNFALEFWTKVPADLCVAGTDQQYLYWLIPCLKNGRVGDVSILNGPLNFTLTADGFASSTWLQGPYDVVKQDIAGLVPGPLLVALPDDVPLHVQLTTVAPPTELCGCQPMP